MSGFQVTSIQPEIACVKIDVADRDKRKKLQNGLLKEQRFRRVGILSAVRSGNSKRVLCKSSSAVKSAVHAGLAEKWSWNFIQKSVIENDAF